MYIKVDYSEKRKSPEGYANMPGEYAIYTKIIGGKNGKKELHLLT